MYQPPDAKRLVRWCERATDGFRHRPLLDSFMIDSIDLHGSSYQNVAIRLPSGSSVRAHPCVRALHGCGDTCLRMPIGKQDTDSRYLALRFIRLPRPWTDLYDRSRRTMRMSLQRTALGCLPFVPFRP